MKFTANNLLWQIDFVDDENILMNHEGDVYFGLTHYCPQKISIRANMSPELTREAVVHELVHCFLFSYGIRGKIEEAYSEEAVCCFVAAHADSIVKLADEFLQNASGSEG